MDIKKQLILFSALLLLFLSACKQRKEMHKAKNEEKPIVSPSKISLIDSVQLHSFKFQTLSAKIKTEFKSANGNDLSVMVTLRIVNDSAIWMSISPALGIEAARVLFTRDSIKIMDKINAQYAVEPYSFLKRFSETDITYAMLQNIFTGNAAFMNTGLVTDSITRYYLAHTSTKDLFQELVISKVFRILGNILTDKNTSDKINIAYGDFQFVEKEFFPFDVKIDMDSKGKRAQLFLNFSSLSVNSPVEIKFHIPASYTKMSY